MKVPLSRFAKIIGRSKQRISEWIAEGMPADPPGKRGAPRMIDAPAAIAWLAAGERERSVAPDGGESFRAVQLRRAIADADLAEQKVREQAAKLVSVADALAAMGEAHDVLLRSVFEALPDRVVDAVAAAATPAAVRALLRDQIKVALREVAAELRSRAEAKRSPQ